MLARRERHGLTQAGVGGCENQDVRKCESGSFPVIAIKYARQINAHDARLLMVSPPEGFRAFRKMDAANETQDSAQPSSIVFFQGCQSVEDKGFDLLVREGRQIYNIESSALRFKKRRERAQTHDREEKVPREVQDIEPKESLEAF